MPTPKSSARRHKATNNHAGQIRDIAVKRTDLYFLKSWRDAELAQELIDGKKLRFNVRDDFTDLFEFANSLVPPKGKKEGIIVPLRGYMGENGKFQITDGERRWRAAKILSQRNIELAIPVIREPQGYTTRERNLDLLRTNNGKPLSMLEQAHAMQRLIVAGDQIKTLHKLAGCSPTHVVDCLALLEAPEEIQTAVAKGEISGTLAADLGRRVPDKKKQVEVLEQGRAKAAEKGKKKVTAKLLSVATGKKAQREKRERSSVAAGVSPAPKHEAGTAASTGKPLTHPAIKPDSSPVTRHSSLPSDSGTKKLEALLDAVTRGDSEPERYATLETLTDYLRGMIDLARATKFILGIG